MIIEPQQGEAFHHFWTDFLEEQRLVRDYYISVSRLLLYTGQMSPEEKAPILEGLLRTGLKREPGYKMAWAVLKQEGIPPTFEKNLILEADQLMKQPLSGYEEAAILADILLILYRLSSSESLPLIEAYLIHFPISPYWTQVAWGTWDKDPELFYAAWRRYFLSEPEENWMGTKLIELFKNRPETIPRLLEHIRLFSESHFNKVAQAFAAPETDSELQA
jgi:hypothetical protein